METLDGKSLIEARSLFESINEKIQNAAIEVAASGKQFPGRN
ncbi:hypothetical protein ACO2KH_14340 [Leptospira terpstrae]